MIEYYQKRAKEYEAIYHKPERQADLRVLEKQMTTLFQGEQVLEIACGTGYWTPFIASCAASVIGIDINQEVLDIAAQKNYPKSNVHLVVSDYKNYQAPEKFDAVFGGFIWSHIRKEALADFIRHCLQWLRANGKLVFLDNLFVDGSSTPISRIDTPGNSYQIRKLSDGTQFEVIKNFPSQAELTQLFNSLALSINWIKLDYYWLIEVHHSR